MITQNKEKIQKAEQLLALITQRKEIERAEAELKDYFKSEITDGVLQAGEVTILIQQKTRTSLDREGLEKKLGKDEMKLFEKITEYEQVTVTNSKK